MAKKSNAKKDNKVIYKNIDLEKYTKEDQSGSYVFVGKFISDFAKLELRIDQSIMSYFIIDPSLSTTRKKEIFEKNKSVLSVLQFAVLGSRFINFQMKVEIIKAIIKERTPTFYNKYGNKIFGMVDLLQKMRNLIAHNKTYVFENNIVVARPISKVATVFEDTEKGGFTPEPKGEFQFGYEKSIINEEIQKKMSSQISYISTLIAEHSFVYNASGIPQFISPEELEKSVNLDIMYKGGIYDVEIIK